MQNSSIYENAALIRKRNERERERVRLVNSYYDRLRRKVPFLSTHLSKKRISKVEILRASITYIRALELILTADLENSSSECELCCLEALNAGFTTQLSNDKLFNQI